MAKILLALVLGPWLLLPALVAAEFGLTLQVFSLSESERAINIKLGWSIVNGASRYEVRRTESSRDSYTAIATVTGDNYDVYGSNATAYSYIVSALKADGTTVDVSTTARWPDGSLAAQKRHIKARQTEESATCSPIPTCADMLTTACRWSTVYMTTINETVSVSTFTSPAGTISGTSGSVSDVEPSHNSSAAVSKASTSSTMTPESTTHALAAGTSTSAQTLQTAAGQPLGTNLSGYSYYDNTKAGSMRLRSTFQKNNVYYRYNYNNGIIESTSQNGYDFGNYRNVLSNSLVCKSTSGACKLEAVSFVLHPSTHEIIMWAHFENASGYALGHVAVAWGALGSSFTFGGDFRPTGSDSRDLSFFGDDDGKGYLLSATNTNQDLAIYALSSDWHAVAYKVTTVLVGQRREAPAMAKVDGYYYLFTSIAAGWYPSQGTYISSKAIGGPWSGQRIPGDASTSGAQSGGVGKIGSTHCMFANRWAHQWKYPEASNRQIIMPISFAAGYARYYFYEGLYYLDGKGVFGAQNGMLKSADTAVTSDGGGTDQSKALVTAPHLTTAGSFYAPTKVPFYIQVDLGVPSSPTSFALSTRLVGGSETYYKFNISGSQDGKTFKVLYDGTSNLAMGFLYGHVATQASVRYVRLNVAAVLNYQNGNEANWATGIQYFNVYTK